MHMAPMILGDTDAQPLFSGRAPLSLDEALRMRVTDSHISGGDVHIELRPVHAVGKK